MDINGAQDERVLIFGQPVLTFTIPILRSILAACGEVGIYRGHRQHLLDRVQILETTRTDTEKRIIRFLLKHRKPVSRASIAAGIPVVDPTPAKVDQAESEKTKIDENGELECEICADTKLPSEFPAGKITPTCTHESLVCKTCLAFDINTQIQSKTWELVVCIKCAAILPTDVVKQYTTPETFGTFNDFMISWHLKDLRNFRWCQNPSCGNGQVYPTAADKRVICYKCGNANCFHCFTAWHEGKTCKAAMKERLSMLEPDEATDLLMSSTTNVCPKCNAKVERNGGCPNMMCRCGQVFIWKTPAKLVMKLPIMRSASPSLPAHSSHSS